MHTRCESNRGEVGKACSIPLCRELKTARGRASPILRRNCVGAWLFIRSLLPAERLRAAVMNSRIQWSQATQRAKRGEDLIHSLWPRAQGYAEEGSIMRVFPVCQRLYPIRRGRELTRGKGSVVRARCMTDRGEAEGSIYSDMAAGSRLRGRGFR